MFSARAEYKAMLGSGFSRWGAIWFVAMAVVASPFLALAEWATPRKDGFGKFKMEDDVDDDK